MSRYIYKKSSLKKKTIGIKIKEKTQKFYDCFSFPMLEYTPPPSLSHAHRHKKRKKKEKIKIKHVSNSFYLHHELEHQYVFKNFANSFSLKMTFLRNDPHRKLITELLIFTYEA